MTDLPDISPNLGLPFYLTKQNAFEVQHNEALLVLDALVMLSVIDRDLASPPAEPAFGDRYIVASPGAGAFEGKDNRIAQYDVGGWNFYAPQEGWTCYVRDEHALLAWDGEAWEPAIHVLGEVTELQNLARLGVGTEADATNPFAAKLNNALWAARTSAEGGDGNLRYKLSKESADKTLSLLFQTDYEGRAEIGLAGDDDFRVKVSADGETWLDAIVIDRETGAVSMPHTPPPGAPADIDIALAQLALGLADALNTAQFLGASGNRFADSFDTLDYVDAAGASNLDSATAGVLKPTSGQEMIPHNAGTLTGDMTANGGNAAAFDNNTAQSSAAGARSANGNSNPCYLQKDWGSGNDRIVDRLRLYAPNSGSTMWDSFATGTVTLQGSHNGSDFTNLYSQSHAVPSAGGNIDITSGITTSTAYRYHRIVLQCGGAGTPFLAEAQLFESAGAGDMTVASEALTAAAAPAAMKVVARIVPVDAIALDTDFKIAVSRDDGTSWTTATLHERFVAGGIHLIESDAIDVSGQPNGTAVKWRIETLNGKSVEVHDLYLYWS